MPPGEHRTRPEHGEQTKARLVAIAREMFAADGHAGVALQDVCDRAGVTRGALYHHFPGKDALFRAVCEDLAGEVTRRVAAAASTQPDAWARLRVGCDAFLKASTDPAVQRVLLLDAPSILGWEAFRELDSRHGLGLLKVGLQAAIDEGKIRPAPVDTLAHMLVAALNEASLVIGRSDSPARARREASVGLERLLAGIAQAGSV